jgi:ABC-type phosphate transport system substrate-binding protein
MTSLSFPLLLLSLAVAAEAVDCGGSFSIAGSASVNRLARTWAKGYTEGCEGGDVRISIEDDSSSTGSARVCGVRRDALPVDVATMTRPMNRLEAWTEDGWRFDCERSTRSTLQVSTFALGTVVHRFFAFTHRQLHLLAISKKD